MSDRLRVCVAVTALLLAGVSTVSADSILFSASTVCPPPSYCSPPYPFTNGLPTVVPDGAPAAFSGVGYYSDFALSTSALVTGFSWVEVEGGGNATITVWSDEGTGFTLSPPGALLADYGFQSAALDAVLLGYAWPDTVDRVFRYTVQLPSPLALLGNTRYWISIADTGAWARNGGGLGYSGTDGGLATDVGFGRGVFDVTGEPAPVPEPATLLLVGAGLLGAARVRSRRRA
jgi:hypothetical protein